MAKWIYTCKNGKGLRNLIDEEDVDGIILQMKKCCQEILDNYPFEDEWDRDAFEEMLDNLDSVDLIIENCRSGIDNIEDFGYDAEEDLIDAYLIDLYDLCDELRIWVEV